MSEEKDLELTQDLDDDNIECDTPTSGEDTTVTDPVVKEEIDKTYFAALAEVDKAVHKTTDDFQIKAKSILELLIEIRDGIKGEESLGSEDEDVIVRTPTNYFDAILYIARAFSGEEDPILHPAPPVKEDPTPIPFSKTSECITALEESDTVKGKSLSDFGEDIKIMSDGQVGPGCIKYIRDFTEYNASDDETVEVDTSKQSGYYFPFKFTSNDDIKTAKMFVCCPNIPGEVIDCEDGANVIFLCNNFSKAKRTIVVITGYDANGTKVDEMVCRFNECKFDRTIPLPVISDDNKEEETNPTP